MSGNMKIQAGAILRRRGILFTAAAATIGCAAGASGQVITNWNTTTGQYIQSVNWDNGAPTAVDYASVNNGGTATIAGSDAGLADILNLGVQTGQSGRLEISGGSLNVGELRVGGRESVPDGVGGTLTNAGGIGTVIQSGGAVNATSTLGASGVQSLYIGDSGQASGNTAVGNYTISAGSLSSGIAYNDSIVVGTGAGTTGAMTQTGGDVFSSGFITVGRRGAVGTWNFSGGTLIAGQDLNIGDGENDSTVGATGSFTHSNNVTFTSTGTLNGTATVTGNIHVGKNGGSGTYTLSGALSKVAPEDDILVGSGASANGLFQQNGGSVAPIGRSVNGGTSGNLFVGRSGGNGLYNLAGGTVNVFNLNVGYGGNATLTQSAGTTLTSRSSMSVGISSVTNGNGLYQMNGGLLNVGTSGDTMAVGNGVGGNGTFVQAGSSNVSLTGAQFQIGRNSGTGQYSLTGTGTLTVSGTSNFSIGGPGSGTVTAANLNGNGTFTQNNAASVVTVAGGDFLIGTTSNSISGGTAYGVYSLQAGTLNLNKAACVFGIGNGFGATGTFSQSGGTVNMTGATATIDIGRNTGNGGAYILSGGRLNATAIALATGGTGSRLFNMTNGVLSAGTLNFGSSASALLRTFSQSGGLATFTTTAGSSAGIMQLSGGTMTVTGAMGFGSGTLAVSGTNDLRVGTMNTGTGLFTFGGNAKLTVNTGFNLNSLGTSQISAPFTVSVPTTMGTTHSLSVNNASVAFNGGMTIGANRTLTTSGTGTLTIGGTQTISAGARISSGVGTLVLNNDAGSAAVRNLNLDVTAGVAKLNSTNHLAALNVSNGADAVMSTNGSRTLYTGAVSLNATGTLDLNDNDLVVTYGTNASSFSDISSKIFNGLLGSDDGTIISTTGRASGGATVHYAIDNGMVGLPDWPQGSGTTIDANSVIAKYTYFGDVNLDGQVDASDYGVIDGGYGSFPDPAIAVVSGDANLDGTVDSSDYGVIDGNYLLGVGNPLSPASLSGGSGLQAVPEPTSLAVMAAGGGLLALRRRRHQTQKQ